MVFHAVFIIEIKQFWPSFDRKSSARRSLVFLVNLIVSFSCLPIDGSSDTAKKKHEMQSWRSIAFSLISNKTT